MRPEMHHDMVRKRPLRWIKFSVLLFFLSICAAKAFPVARVLAGLGSAPFVFHPAPLLGPALALLATLLLFVWTLLDAILDLFLPRGAIAGLVLLAALPWGVRERGQEEEAAHLRQLAVQVAEQVGEKWKQGENVLAPREIILPLPSPYVSRWLVRQPHIVRILPSGVSVAEEEIDRPGVFFVSVSESGGWLRASRLADGRMHLLRSHGAVEVFRIEPPGKEWPHEL